MTRFTLSRTMSAAVLFLTLLYNDPVYGQASPDSLAETEAGRQEGDQEQDQSAKPPPRLLRVRPLRPRQINYTAQIAQLEGSYWPKRPRRSWEVSDVVLSTEEASGDGVWLDPALEEVSAAMFPVTVWFNRQFLGDGKAYARRCEEYAGQSRRVLRARVVDTLKTLGEQSFQAAEEEMRRLVEEERIQLVEWHWIVNGFSCLTTEEGLAGLQRVAGVKKIFFARGRLPMAVSDARQATFVPPQERGPFDPRRFKHPWYVRHLQADKAWRRLGVTGQGTLNVVMDGNFVFSPSVTGNVYRNAKETPGNGQDDDGNGLIDDYHGFNFARNDALLAVRPVGSARFSVGMHGFLCTAVICGTGTESSQYEFGLAPEASWAGVVAGSRFEPAMEWAIEQGADTLSMSFSLPNLGEYRSHWRKVMEQAAFCGLCCVSGAGNFARQGSGAFAPVPVQMRTPEDIPQAVFAPAGVQRNLRRTVFSSQGPVKWETEHYREGLVRKPDFCAFNSGLPALLPDGTVQPTGLNGNSFAGPMLAGTLALMISADPDLLPWDAREILAATTTDVGSPGIDPRTGHGLINCYRAVREVLRRKCVREGVDAKPYEGRQVDDALDPVALERSLARRVHVVRTVLPNSVAGQEGVRVGDVVQTIDGQAVQSAETVRAAVREALEKDARQLILVIRRDDETIEFQLPTPKRGALGIALEERYEAPVFE